MPCRQLCIRIVSSIHADELLIIEHKGYKCKLRRSIFIKRLKKKKNNKLPTARLAAGVNAAPHFSFPSVRTKSVFALATVCRGSPPQSQWQLPTFSHSSHGRRGCEETPALPSPVPFSRPCVYTHCSHGKGRDLWQAACPCGAPTFCSLTHTHLTQVLSAVAPEHLPCTANDTSSYDKTKRELSFGLTVPESSFLWGQCAHKSEPAAVAMAGKEGGISHKEHE